MQIEPGTYVHSKTGKRVQVHFVAKHSESLEDQVCYEELGVNDVSQFWVRPASMWSELVEVGGEKKPRFAPE